MSWNKIGLFVYTFLFLYILYNANKEMQQESYTLPTKSYTSFKGEAFKLQRKIFSVSDNINSYWGFKTIVHNKSQDINKSISLSKVSFDKDKKRICIEKSCYRLLAIHDNKVTFYNNALKKPLLDCQQGDFLAGIVKIFQILPNQVSLKENNSSKIYIYKIFDVNQTQYKPKENDEI